MFGKETIGQDNMLDLNDWDVSKVEVICRIIFWFMECSNRRKSHFSLVIFFQLLDRLLKLLAWGKSIF